MDDYSTTLAAQDGTCVTCDRDATDMDHDHSTGAFRGLLCARCNRVLGTVGDDIAHLERLIAYLRNPPGVATE